MMLMLWLRKSRFFPIQPLSFFVTCITNLKRFSLNIFCHRLPWQLGHCNVKERHVQLCYMVINFPFIQFICCKWKILRSVILNGEIFWSPHQPYFGLDRRFLRISYTWKVRKLIASKFQERFCDALAELCCYMLPPFCFQSDSFDNFS